jgi:NAD-dependent dihydropyrimidine dehydrogenase PreA subunit
MIIINPERCTGCGACVETCPTGALYLVESRATLDEALCHECEACLAACPSGAITLTAQKEPVTETAHLPALRPEPEIARVETSPVPVPLRSRALPVVGAALAWAGREILPWLADLMLDTLNRQATRSQAKNGTRGHETLASGAKGGRRRRHRRRGGG